MGFENSLDNIEKTEKEVEQKPTAPVGDFNPFMALMKKHYDDVVVSINAQSQSGKTVILLQECFRRSHEANKPFLYVDTEGAGKHFIYEWEEVFLKKYPKATYEIVRLPHLKDVGKFFGKLLKIVNPSADKVKSEDAKLNAGHKMSLLLQNDFLDDVEECELYRKCASVEVNGKLPTKKNGEKIYSESGECRYSALVLDSISAIVKYFPAAQQNFPARAYFIGMVYEGLNYMTAKYPKLIAFTVNHSSINPADYIPKERILGGSAIEYNSKIKIQIEKKDGKHTNHIRKLVLVRFFNVKPNTRYVYVALDDNGFHDISEAEVMELAKKK